VTLAFGAFLPPFHTLAENPATSLRFDLELVEWLDALGFDEVWVGEHHSGGVSPVSSPELFLAAAAERTRRIRLGTGVVQLPFHHPLTVAERIVQLDHQSGGRAMLGMGAGTSPLDARMLGIDPADRGRRMSESLDVLVRLLTTRERVTRSSDWFELHNAALQVRPYSKPLDMVLAGVGSDRSARLAGRYGLGLLTAIGRLGRQGPSQAAIWEALEEEASRHGRAADRSRWRISVPVHIADTREEALAQVQPGLSRWFQYNRDVPKVPVPLPEGREAAVAAEQGLMIIGSADDAIERIEQLLATTGGFGTLLVHTQDWASREHVRQSFELLARHVVPHFNQALDSLRAARQWVAANSSAPAPSTGDVPRAATRSGVLAAPA
jgi:limonene 1,2-monooxygenase